MQMILEPTEPLGTQSVGDVVSIFRLTPAGSEREIRESWSKIDIGPSLKRGLQTHGKGDVLQALLRGRMQLWVHERSYCITEVCDYPRMRTLRVIWAGGQLKTIMDKIEDMKAWAESIGCDGVEAFGREGWDVLGWKKIGSVFWSEV